MADLTLQINLSAGDAAYAHLTVPALLAAHPSATERVLVVDLCKPQRTGIVDPVVRFQEPAYSQRAEKILTFANTCLTGHLVDRLVILRPGDPVFAVIGKKWLRPWVRETHDYGGCALMAYFAAFEVCRARWLLHYDADMLLFQAPGYDWTSAAVTAMADTSEVVAAIPRSSPPPLNEADAPSAHERRPLRMHRAGWLNDWFSTRCFLFDLERLQPLLPLLQGRAYWEMVAAKVLRRGYPRSPEILLFRRLGAAHRWRLTLVDRRAWLLHPGQKGPEFVAALPTLLQCVRAGKYPAAQAGQQDLQLHLWREFRGSSSVQNDGGIFPSPSDHRP